MSHTAVIITVAYVVAVFIGSVVAIAVWRSTTRPVDEEPASWSRRETAWLFIVAIGLFGLLMATIFYVPYGETAGANKQVVRVVGIQFAWAIDAPQGIVTGRPVEFLATSADVNHGFGVYDASGTLLFQAQVVPHKTQKIVHTFTKPGIYKVLCLEFCGAKHHKMVSAFRVRRA